MLSIPSTKRPSLQLGHLKLASRYVLAPLAGYTNMPFRLAIRELGGLGLATTDLVNARALLRGSRKSLELVDTCPDDQPLSIQLYGADPVEMKAAAQWCESYGVASIDINMGCPVHKVTKGGGGSAMMCDPASTVNLVATVVDAVQIPVTVKMRLGWDETSWSAPHFAREFEKVGIAGLIIHGRTRAQGFTGTVSLAGIKAVVDAVQRIPIIGNGDMRNLADAQRMLQETGCTGLAIGRGALLNPWIFSQLSTWEETGDAGPSASFEDHVDFMHRHYHLLVDQRGEHFASLTFRKVANWYCRVLHPGRAIQQRLMFIEKAADFDVIVDEIRDNARTGGTAEWVHPEPSIAVPRGPIERW
jgi:nifR3 family TIM-barrel protein